MNRIIKPEKIRILKQLPNILWPVRNMKNVIYIQKKEKCVEDYGWPNKKLVHKFKK